jgi:hypothetical protein
MGEAFSKCRQQLPKWRCGDDRRASGARAGQLWGKWPDLQLLRQKWGDRLLYAERTGASSIGDRLLVRSAKQQNPSTGVASRHIRVHSQSDTCPIFQTWPERSRRNDNRIVNPTIPRFIPGQGLASSGYQPWRSPGQDLVPNDRLTCWSGRGRGISDRASAGQDTVQAPRQSRADCSLREYLRPLRSVSS